MTNYRAFWDLIAHMPITREGLLKTADGPAKLTYRSDPDYTIENDPESLALL